MRRGNSGLIGEVATSNKNQTSGVFSAFEQRLLRKQAKWPTEVQLCFSEREGGCRYLIGKMPCLLKSFVICYLLLVISNIQNIFVNIFSLKGDCECQDSRGGCI